MQVRNTGDCNTGICNTGNCNTGNCNTGNMNTTTLNNKTLRTKVEIFLNPRQPHTEGKYHQYVIIATRDGVRKYVARGFPSRHGYLYTVKIQKAHFFDNANDAMTLIKNFKGSKFEIHEPEIHTILHDAHGNTLTLSLL